MNPSTKASKIVSALKQNVPWRLKIAAKILLARLPLGYHFWESLSLFKHGNMERPEYAFGVFRTHFDRVQFARKNAGSFVALELGPGDSLFSAVIAKVLGSLKVYLVDVRPFARHDLGHYRSMVSFLRENGFSVPEFQNWRTLEELLEAYSAHYLTAGLPSLRTIPSESVDFVWSHAVLEHIRREDFFPTLQELRRVQRPDGIGSHRVDLKDHLGGALNNLRFQKWTWESEFMSKSGFYTNRIRYSEMLRLFRQAGFDVKVLNVDRWSHLPTPRRKLARPFRDLPEEELAVSGLDVLLQ